MSMNGALRLTATHAAIQNKSPQDDTDRVHEGWVIPGSWTASEGVCQVAIGDTIGLENAFFADGDQPIIVFARILNPQIGDQYAPVGGERVLLWQGYAGWVCKFYHGPDDTSPVPSGERWIQHRSAAAAMDEDAPIAWDSSLKLQNDGPTTGDGLGGAVLGGTGALTQSQTASGARHTIDDTAQKIESVTQAGQVMAAYDQVMQIVHAVLPGILQAVIDGNAKTITHQASAQVKTIVDATGKTISLVVPRLAGGTIGLGDHFANLPSTFGAINQNILSVFGSNINSANLQTLINLAVAMGRTGANIPNASALVPLIVTSLIQKVGIPAGSGVVRIAS